MRKLPAIAMCTLALAAPLAAQDDPAALVIRVQGDVSVTHGADAPTPASVGEQMFVGDGVQPSAGGRAILLTRVGAQQVVTVPTTIAEPQGTGNTDIFARAMVTLAQAAAVDASTASRPGMIRPIPGATTLLGPREGLAVSSQRPTFTWTATPGQTYDLMLQKVGDGRPQVFEVGTDTTWTLPPDVPELERGAVYSWTVFVGGRRGGRPQPLQQFRVISLIESVEMQDYLDEIAVFGLDPMGDGLFLTVVAYRDLELFYDARAALEEVEAQASLSPELYMLKGEILAELALGEAARAAFDRADELMR